MSKECTCFYIHPESDFDERVKNNDETSVKKHVIFWVKKISQT